MIGRKLKNYQIEELLGEGGMGVVYRAKDVNLNRMVALKMLHPEMLHQPDLLKRFKNEAHVTARLTHPNIATLYDFFSEDGLHCLVMEYLMGKTLEEVLQVHKRLPAQECIRILMQLLEGLEEAHANEILHRDIKPGNIMINQSGYVKLMDFGVARFESSARITRMNRVIGTLEYMAPELLTGGKPNIQADLYSVGVVAYEMYTGKLPFEAENDGELTELILKGAFSYPAQLPGFEFHRHKKLENIINKLMHKKTSKRYLSSKDVLADLNACSVSGRVSVSVLGKGPISDPVPEKSGGLLINAVEKVKEAASGILENLPAALKSAGKVLRSKYPAALEFLKTTEGKIIGGAVGFAILLFLLANIFNDRTPGGGLPDVAENEVGEETAVNYSGMSGNVLPNVAEDRQNDREEADTSNNWRAPLPVVIPSQGSRTGPGGNRDSRQQEANEAEPLERIDQDDRTESSESKNQRIRDNSEAEENPDTRGRTESDSSENTQQSREPDASARRISVSVNNTFVEGVFNEPVSTLTHKEGDTFYLVTSADVYADGYKVIEAGAGIRGVVRQVRDRGRSRRATLAVTFEEVEAIDGTKLKISYPEYSNQATGSVTFEKGRSISRLRIESGTVTLELE